MKLAIPPREPDWQDCHSGPRRPELGMARDAYAEGMAVMPGWAQFALAARNRIVGLFGLRTGSDQGGDLMTSLPVLTDTTELYECGLTDKHLTFTLSTRLEGGRISITTSIWFNHWSGRLYLAVVLIPHKLIVKQTIRRLA
ncbi:MAG: DUF2867 domain-containing protein [Pikeienuella sp.]